MMNHIELMLLLMMIMLACIGVMTALDIYCTRPSTSQLLAVSFSPISQSTSLVSSPPIAHIKIVGRSSTLSYYFIRSLVLAI